VANNIVNDAIFIKTLEGKAQLNQRSLALSILQRRVLILSDGSRSVAVLAAMLNTDVEPLIQTLIELNLLVASASSGKPDSVLPRSAVPEPVQRAKAQVKVQAKDRAMAPTQPVELMQAPFASEDLDHGNDMAADDLAQDFYEELTHDGSSGFEREISGFPQAATGGTYRNNAADSAHGSDPSSTLQRAITARGIALGKAYLINISSKMLDARDAALLRNISQIKTEGELYHWFEQMIDTINSRHGPSAISEILDRFDEEISRA
jgi:hypothetical protein